MEVQNVKRQGAQARGGIGRRDSGISGAPQRISAAARARWGEDLVTQARFQL